MVFGESSQKLGSMLHDYDSRREVQQKEDERNIKKKRYSWGHDKGLRLWNGEYPNKDNSTMILETSTRQLLEDVPFHSSNIPKLEKVGDLKKVNHGALTSKDGRTLELWVERVDKVEEYKAPGIFPIQSETTAGKEGKANQGGKTMKPVIVYSDIHNNGVIDNSAKAVQVGTPYHACRLLETGNCLDNLEEGETRKVTGGNGNKFIAELAKGGESGLGPRASDLPKANRFVPDNVYTKTTSVLDLEKINAHHAKTGEWTRSILPKKAKKAPSEKRKRKEKSANKSKDKKAPSKRARNTRSSKA